MAVPQNIRKGALVISALAASALGGSAIAGAASNSSSSSSTTGAATAPSNMPPGGQRPDPTKPGGHVGKFGTEKALSADVAAKVKAAAQAKISGGTVLRVETDADSSSPYEAHVRKSDGTEVEVLVNKDFEVTAVNTMAHP
jgi:hypothetical protein